MGDLKEGVCSYGYWLDKAACCFPSNDTLFNIDHCSEWKEWSQLLHVDGDNTSYAVNYILYLAIAVAFAALSAVLVKVFAPYACGSGIPEVKTILSGFVIRGYLGAWTLLIKALTMMTAVAAGLSLGKEGPLVHVACCCGNIFSRLFPKYRKNEAKKREVLSAAAAAGVSVAFGAPIGGVLFSLEEVSYYFPHKVLWRSFFSALTAMLVLTYMNPYFTGKLVLFYANYDGPWNIAELICFIFLGILGGLYGAIFIKINLKWSKLRKTSKLGKHAVLEVIVIAVITSVIAYISPFTRGGASATIGRLFRQCEPADVGDPLCDYAIQLENQHDSYVFGLANSELWKCVWELALACIFKGIITIFTFGIKVPAGLFIPSMYVGACFGRIFGILVQQLVFSNRTHPLFKQMCEATPGCVIPGLYAMVGAAASLGGVTRMTVSLVVIMFELTGGLTYIIPLMVAIVTSKWVGDAFGRDGIYDGHIHLNGYPFMDSKREFKHTTLAADVMRPRPRCNEPPLQTIPATSATVGDIEHLLDETDYFGFPVVLSEDSQLLAGYVNSSEIARALAHARSADTQITSESVVYFTRDIPRHLELEQSHPVSLNLWLDKSPFCIIDQTPIDTVIEIFRKMGLRHTLVTHNGRLLGIITKKDLLRHIAQMTNMDPESILFH
ncbi:H(+)/Cl(-) exchange transporter 3-like isoform X2 [Corticium candelabrum]|nr:H(+)/Cl(-) exchange transporter 3-like isoform X2 [Corticium candelabrum]